MLSLVGAAFAGLDYLLVGVHQNALLYAEPAPCRPGLSGYIPVFLTFLSLRLALSLCD